MIHLSKWILAFSVLSSAALAKLHIEDQSFEGIVSKFNSKSVTVMHKGKLWEVSKNNVQPNKNLKVGATVVVSMSEDEFKKVKVSNPQKVKTKKKRSRSE